MTSETIPRIFVAPAARYARSHHGEHLQGSLLMIFRLRQYAGAAGQDRSAAAESGEASQRAGAGGSDRDSGASWVGASADGAGEHGPRGLAKSYGERLRGCNLRNMNPEKAEGLSPELQRALEALLALESLSEQIAEYNERIEQLAQQGYPQVALLKQIMGVGTLMALTFLLTLEDPHVSARAETWAAIWACSQDAETRARANRKSTSARRAIRTCAPCWCKEHSISWDRSVWTAICGAGA
jgi:hypothetical protein